MRLKSTICGFAALALGATVALAQPSPAPTGETQRQTSLFISPMGEPFRANASGARGVDLWFAALDANYDTRISHDEFIANANAFFARVDANQDGALTSVEDIAYWRVNAPEVVNGRPTGEPIGNTIEPPRQREQERGLFEVRRDSNISVSGPSRGLPPERQTGAQPYGLLGDAEPILSCDSNFDRRVTLTEFDTCAERRFAQLDANHDGFITPDEINQIRRTSGDVIRVSR